MEIKPTYKLGEMVIKENHLGVDEVHEITGIDYQISKNNDDGYDEFFKYGLGGVWVTENHIKGIKE